MASTILFTESAAKWIRQLPVRDQVKLSHRIDQLAAAGPQLGRPAADTVHGSRHRNMKELRPTASPQRLLFAFDERGRAIMLVGGNKASGSGRHAYRDMIRLADARFAAHRRGTGREITWAATKVGMKFGDRSR